MISLKKYLDATPSEPERGRGPAEGGVLSLVLRGYRAALTEMGDSSVEACSVTGHGLQQSLVRIADRLSNDTGAATLEATQIDTQTQLQDWGRKTAGHYRQKSGEVKDLLLVMARMAESVGERDQRCAGQISAVTTRLQTIASLDDLTEIRSSIEQSAAELKASLERMAEEGKQAIAELRAEVSSYQVKLEEAEELAARDVLTGLHNRFWVEGQIERRVQAGSVFAVAIIDMDKFKRVNDDHGHLVGDELLQKFATELKSASRSKDVIGRWGGDEFILVLDSSLQEAEAQIDRLHVWVCGSYDVTAAGNPMKLKVEASIGLAEHQAGESMKELLARADAAMYLHKAACKGNESGARR
jgi:diguanylate cyclase (GGDEF)-like protein